MWMLKMENMFNHRNKLNFYEVYISADVPISRDKVNIISSFMTSE
jgi:hypothetical protein